jgi:tripartite ATP-independent transporter DctP family solute receptor
MTSPIEFRIGGYSPPDSTHSRASVHFKESLEKKTVGAVSADIFWNILDFGYRADDLLSMVECGLLTMCYFSTSYLASAVPELEVIDLPFVFEDEGEAHSALDGALGEYLTEKTEERTGFRVLGYWDNGFRHISNRLRPVRTPADCEGMRIRLQPNDVHVKTFELLGAIPVPVDLKEGIEKIISHEVDAQENPLANTVTYGVIEHHRHVTMSGHFFGARGLYIHKNSFDSWDAEVQSAVRESAREAIRTQRALASAKEAELRAQLESEGIEIIDLTAEERAAFAEAVQPVLDDARGRLGDRLFGLIEKS